MDTHAKVPVSRRMLLGTASGLMAATLLPSNVSAALVSENKLQVHGRMASIDGIDIFYREAGSKGAPVVLLLHGFPTSSRMFRDLIPQLASRYHVIAPDYPAFGHSAVASRDSFAYTHARVAEILDGLLRSLNVERFALYVMDFGGPIGYRLMLQYPDRFRGIIIQNTPAFGEPISGPVWAPLVAYWKDDSPENRAAIRASLSPEAVRQQYVAGVRDTSLLEPDSWTIDSALLARPGVDEIMLDMLHDIRSNKPVVEAARRFFAAHQRQVMIATGYNDPLFPGESMRPPAELTGIEFHPIDSGHFALEDKSEEIGELVLVFLNRVFTG